jgi:hypothetical protein
MGLVLPDSKLEIVDEPDCPDLTGSGHWFKGRIIFVLLYMSRYTIAVWIWSFWCNSCNSCTTRKSGPSETQTLGDHRSALIQCHYTAQKLPHRLHSRLLQSDQSLCLQTQQRPKRQTHASSDQVHMPSCTNTQHTPQAWSLAPLLAAHCPNLTQSEDWLHQIHSSTLATSIYCSTTLGSSLS